MPLQNEHSPKSHPAIQNLSDFNLQANLDSYIDLDKMETQKQDPLSIGIKEYEN